MKSNLVSKLLDISEQDPDLQFENSDFQYEVDSTVLVRERARGTKLQGAFDKMSGRKIKESAHTITLLPEGSSKPKMYAKRDVAVATKEQKEKFRNTNEPGKKKRARIETTSESGSTENKTERKKKQKKTILQFTADVEMDNEEEVRPLVIDLTASRSTEEELSKKKGEVQRGAPDEKTGNVQNTQKSDLPHKGHNEVGARREATRNQRESARPRNDKGFISSNWTQSLRTKPNMKRQTLH